MEKKKKRIIQIIILILIIFNLVTACCYIRTRNKLQKEEAPTGTDTVFDNSVIVPEPGDNEPPEATPTPTPTATPEPTATPAVATPTPTPIYIYPTPVVIQESADLKISNLKGPAAERATPMVLKNMFPGDSISSTYTLTAEYTVGTQSETVLSFYSKVRDESDLLLLEGLDMVISQNDQIVWQGKISEINGEEKSIQQKISQLDAGQSGTMRHKWDITITVSLPTSAGNEYQNLQTIIDFYWELKTDGANSGGGWYYPPVSPKTGDTKQTALWAGGAIVLLAAILIVLKKLRKEDDSVEK